jgi:cytochrome P450
MIRHAQVHLRILQRSMVVVGSAEGLKRVFQTNARNYVKDLDFSFHPFLPILGTGLVTAQGALWQSQRLLMAPTLRVDVLDDVVSSRPAMMWLLCVYICPAGDGENGGWCGPVIITAVAPSQ